MSGCGDAALCLAEALISHLEAEGVLTPDCTSVIYDKAIQLLHERVSAGAEDVAPTLHAEGSRIRR